MNEYPKVDKNLIKVTDYQVLGKLPDPFVMDDGTPITSPDQWADRRREMYKTAIELQYGPTPPEPDFLDVTLLSKTPKVVVYSIVTGPYAHPVRFTMTLIKPRGDGPFPAVVDGDLCFQYPFTPNFGDTFVNNGIMLVLFNRTELAPDISAAGRNGQMYSAYPGVKFGALQAWAWGYSRCVDALEKIGLADMNCITFTGHSRGGKTAMLAGALDERAAIVNPNETCAGGCGCYRIHMEAEDENGKVGRSETLKDILRPFTFWFGEDLPQYADKEEELPFDSHFLKAMVAPRTLFISEAGSDIWANPIGSWQTTMAAKEVFKFLGAEDNVFWYFRRGFHFHKIQDIEMLVNVILHKKDGQPLHEDFFKTPFEEPELIFDWKAPETK